MAALTCRPAAARQQLQKPGNGRALHARAMRARPSGRPRIAVHVAATSILEKPDQQVTGTSKREAESGLPTFDKAASGAGGKTRVVVLGSGWASMSFIKALSPEALDKYELILLSPRNYFVYTPLLPAMCAGTVEERSIVEPVRSVLAGKGRFFEAKCTEILPEEKAIVACFPEDAGFPEACFKLSYDLLVLGVGCNTNTFGIQGVAEHTTFLKSVEDANRLRNRIQECFERAALPQTTPEERKKLLSFVIVGGGPTGIEVAAELYDLLRDDLAKLYPEEAKDASISVVELMSHVLSTYDRAISDYTAKIFNRNGIQLILNSRVQSVGPSSVTVVDKEGSVTEVPFGACVWATGIAMHPLVKQLQERLPAGTQSHFRSVVTDEYLRVKGSNGSIFALGDASTIEQQKAVNRANELFDEFDKDGNGVLDLAELQALMKEASKEFPHLLEHSRFLDGKVGSLRFGGLVASAFAAASGKPDTSPLASVDPGSALSREQFAELLTAIDAGLRALPATAQVALQQGEYLAGMFNTTHVTPGCELGAASGVKGFEYFHKGSMAYVGSERGVMDVPVIGPIVGLGAGLIWKAFETYSQISPRTRALVAIDWIRTRLYGRDTSRV